MKKTPLFLFLYILVISSFIGAAFIADDDESQRDKLCNLNIDAILPQLDCFASSIALIFAENSWASLPLISYLAQHEKSPPCLSLVKV